MICPDKRIQNRYPRLDDEYEMFLFAGLGLIRVLLCLFEED